YLPRRLWPAAKAPHLEIRRPFDEYGCQRYQRRYTIQPCDLCVAVAQRRPQRQASQEDQDGRQQVDAEEAHRPEECAVLLAYIPVAPVFVTQPAPLDSP